MSRKLLFLILVVMGMVLVACDSASPAELAPTVNASAAEATAATPGSDLARTDSQGSVEFVITPLNFATPGETLDFNVVMDTHSVDLSWDLAAQSMLTTNTDLEVKGLSWLAGSGHHYENTLAFPTKTADGKLLLADATKLTLTFRDAAAPIRVFEWEIAQ